MGGGGRSEGMGVGLEVCTVFTTPVGCYTGGRGSASKSDSVSQMTKPVFSVMRSRCDQIIIINYN